MGQRPRIKTNSRDVALAVSILKEDMVNRRLMKSQIYFGSGATGSRTGYACSDIGPEHAGVGRSVVACLQVAALMTQYAASRY